MAESASYQLLRLAVTEQAAETAEDLLLFNGALSCSLTDAADTPLLEPEPGQTPLWPELVITGMFDRTVDLQPLAATLGSTLGQQLHSIEVSPLQDQQWERVWMRDFAPTQVSEKLWIVPSFAEPPDPAALNLTIDPGLAFGSGTHATTMLCLQWLAGQDLQNKTILDYGCGSGILAIAAAMLGARKVVALDIDPQACLATLDNAERNGVARQISVLEGEGDAGCDYDVVVANILLTPLLERVERFAEMLRPGGMLALSGVLGEQATQLRTVYDVRFSQSEIVRLDDWLLYSAMR
jgi:ribosomal protein L11 methyltransferase